MMKTSEAIRQLMAGLLALVIVGTAAPSFAATASELFADGNRLFREDLYWAALLRYNEAAEAGMDTPLLHYNTGVAHYKAQQYDRARMSLEKAAAYGPLAPVAHYNLGLNAYAAGAYDEAMGWFRQSANQEARKDIARLSRRAMSRLRETRAEEAPVIVARSVVRQEYQFTNFDFRLRTGMGMDDNVFRTPAEPYVDVSDPNNPVPVVPVVQSGTYIPVNLSARYQVNALENEGFFGSYRFAGRFYQDETLNNADEYFQELAFGSEYNRRSENRATRVYSAFKIAQHDENYYDPDTGAEREVNGVDISDRMSYLRYGPEFWGRKRFGRFTFGARAKGQLWDYEEVEVVPEYDHEFWNLGLHSDIRMTSTSLLRLSGEYYTRRFSDRPSFELDGTQPLGNPPVRYDYAEYAIEARQRVTDAFWFGIGYSRTDREDRHVGYNNYVRDEYAFQLRLNLGDRFTFGSRLFYQNYNYENAFAFQEPTAGRKTLERAVASANATYRISDSFEIVGEYYYRDVASNDTRLAYNRSMASLAVRWIPWSR
jgi:tetratricopeptide (TPR) repeat protein